MTAGVSKAVATARARASPRLQAAGVAMIVASTVAIAIVPTFAKMAFNGGSNTLTIITGRSILSIVITMALILALRQPLRIARSAVLTSLAMGVTYAVMLYGYLGAVQFLPVNLVILIYFIHPLLVGLIVAGLGQEQLSLFSIAAPVLALTGLGLAIGFSFASPNPKGLALAALAMVMVAVTIVGNASAMKQAPGLSVVFYMMLSAAIVLTALFVVFGALALPTTSMSWLGLIGVAVAATAGTLMFNCGMEFVGAARAAMISNLEPVLGVLFSLTVLGERVTLLQGAGIVMVLASITAMELRR